MNITTVEQIIELDARVKQATGQFYNTGVAATVHDPMFGHIFGELQLTATDLLLAGILADVHILVSGPTGRGKTELVKLICRGIFGTDGWFLLRLNPHLTEETFANIDMATLSKSTLRDAVTPAPFLGLPVCITDELNRCPSALTNILLGFTDGRIELKCGLKYDVGHRYRTPDGEEHWYHLVIGTMNEGKEYAGTFEMDPALRRRFTLQIDFGELRPAPVDLVNIVESRTGHAESLDFETMINELVMVSHNIRRLPLNPLAFVYLIYLGNVGRCPYSPTGFHPQEPSQELCSKAQCRIQKIANAFCPSVSGLSEGLLIFLKRASCGLAALRAARTIQKIRKVLDDHDGAQIEQLKDVLDVKMHGDEMGDVLINTYLSSVAVTAGDIGAMLPFVGFGGKVWMVQEYIAKHFAGSPLLALREYARLTYAGMESFFREHQSVIRQLSGGNGALEKLKQRLEYAERFDDPYIRHTIEPLLERNHNRCRGPGEIAQEIDAEQAALVSAKQIIE